VTLPTPPSPIWGKICYHKTNTSQANLGLWLGLRLVRVGKGDAAQGELQSIDQRCDERSNE